MKTQAKGAARGLLAWTLGVVAVLVAVVVLVYATGTAQRITASFRGETEQIENTEGSGRFRQGTYEQFFDLCSAVQTDESRIESLETELDTDPSDSRVERINTSLGALRSSRTDKINDYNALAAQEHTEAFQDADLPERLDEDNTDTECA